MIERIVLHAGTPKTGTTSLQKVLDRDRVANAARGVLYAEQVGHFDEPAGREHVSVPKHQWLILDLVDPEAEAFESHFEEMLAGVAPGVRSLVLSTEGIYNHWWDFSPTALAALRDLARRYRVEIWVWFRDPVAFFSSLYVQSLKNPRIESVPSYGRDWPAERALEDPWFAQRLDYGGFLERARDVLGGPEFVRIFTYRGTTVADFLAAIELPGLDGPEPRENTTLGAYGVDALRLLNRLDLTGEEKARAVRDLGKLDSGLGDAWRPFVVSDAVRRDVESRYGAAFARLEATYANVLR